MNHPHIVAITRMPASPSGEPQATATDTTLQLLAKLLKALPFDLRRQLAGAAPWIISRFADSAESSALVNELRALDFGAVAVDVRGLDIITLPLKSLVTFEDQTLVIQPTNIRVNLAHISAIFVASHNIERSTETVEEVVVARGNRGQPIKAEMSHHHYDRKSGKGLYLATEFNRQLLCLSQEELRLPWISALTARERMDRFVEDLVERCPFARIDRSMLEHPRTRREYSDSAMKMQMRDSSTSNRFECDVVARVLITAIEQRQ